MNEELTIRAWEYLQNKEEEASQPWQRTWMQYNESVFHKSQTYLSYHFLIVYDIFTIPFMSRL